MTTFNAGAIEAELTLDRSRFNKELGYAKQMATKFSKTKITPTLQIDGEEELARIAAMLEALGDETVHVDIDVDDSPLDDLLRKLKTVNDRVTNLNKRKIKVETEVKDKKVQDLKDDLDDLSDTEVETVVEVDDRASTELVRIERQLERIDDEIIYAEIIPDTDETGLVRFEERLQRIDNDIIDVEFEVEGLPQIEAAHRYIESIDPDINVDVDSRGEEGMFAKLKAKIMAFEMMNDIDLRVNTRGIMSALPALDLASAKFGHMQLIALAVVALLPLIGPLFASLAGVIGALGTALIGAGGGLAIFGGALFSVGLEFNLMGQKVEQAKEKLAGMEKGTDEYAAQLAKVKKLQSEYNETFGPMRKGLDDVKAAWGGFIDSIRPQAVQIMGKSLQIVADMIPGMSPIFGAFGDVAESALGKIAAFVNGPEWTRVIDFFQNSGASSFDLLLSTLGNLVLFFGRMGEAFAPFTEVFLQGLSDMTARWAEWADGLGQTEGFQNFIDYVVKEGPRVWALIENMITGFINLGVAIAPLSALSLTAFNAFFEAMGDMDPALLGAIAVGITTMTAAVVGFNAVMAIVSMLAAMNPFVLIAIAIVGIVAAIATFVAHNEQAMAVVTAVWNGIKAVVGPVLTSLWASLQPLIAAVQGLAIQLLQYLTPAAQAIAAAFMWALPYLMMFGQFIGGFLLDTIKGLIAGITDVVVGVTNILGGLWEFVAGVFTGNWSRAWDGIKQIFSGVLQAIWGVIQVVWHGGVLKAFGLGFAIIKALFKNSLGAVLRTVVSVFKSMGSRVKGGINLIRSVINAGLGFVLRIFRTIWNAVKSVVSGAWSGLRSVVSGGMNFLRSAIGGGLTFIRNYFVSRFNAIRSLVSSVFSAIRSRISSAMNSVRSVVSSVVGSVRSRISSGFNSARSAAANAFNGMVNAIRGALGRARSAVSNIISSIRNMFSGAAGWLTGSGRSIVQGLASGIWNAVGSATDAIKGVISRVRDFLPFSPAKVGPFSGRGYTTYSGRALVRDLAGGMVDNIGEVERNANLIAEAAMPNIPGMNGPGFGTATYTSRMPEYAPPAPQFYGKPQREERNITVEYKVYNPLPETSSETAIRETTRLGQLGIFDG